jgi:hypothetical protein
VLPPDVETMKGLIRSRPPDEVVVHYILAPQARHVSLVSVEHIRRRLSETFSCSLDDVHVYIVGSAKLGYSLTEGRGPTAGAPKARFRNFTALSDIDVAVYSPVIFDTIWGELSIRASYEARLPWRCGDLGNYLLSGWWRPDHFPRRGVRSCDLWWDLFNEFTTSRLFDRHKVRGGMFYSKDDLVRYQTRSVIDCKRSLTEPTFENGSNK